MIQQIVELECPGCGKAITTSTTQCPQCFREIVISTFNSVSSMSAIELNKQANAYKKAMTDNPDDKNLNMSLAFCYLKLKMFDKAAVCFEKAVEDNFDNSETYFYAAISLLNGKRPFVTPIANIKKAVQFLEAAVMIEPKGIYYYLMSYIKYDFYSRKFIKTDPDYKACMLQAKNTGYSQNDKLELFKLLGTEVPTGF